MIVYCLRSYCSVILKPNCNRTGLVMVATTEEMASTLTKQERSLRQRFVSEYLVDYDPVSAAIRLGYQVEFAKQYSSMFLTEPYTLRLIAEKEQELGLVTEEDQHRHKIISGLYRESRSPFNTGSARVAALTQLAKIVGIEAPIKTEVKVKNEGQDLSALTDEELKQLHEITAKLDDS